MDTEASAASADEAVDETMDWAEGKGAKGTGAGSDSTNEVSTTSLAFKSPGS
jgi:hypothetical protein